MSNQSPETHRNQLRTIMHETLQFTDTAHPLNNGACPHCFNTTFNIIARIDSWGTYLDNAHNSQLIRCEKCQQKVQLC